MKSFTAHPFAVIAAMLNRNVAVNPHVRARRDSDTVLTNKALLEMKEGENFVLCYPGGSVLFECKKHHVTKDKIQGTNGHIFYDEMPDFPIHEEG